MHVLVADQDPALLTAINEALGDYFSIDVATTKADCLDLVRINKFDAIVAGERLEDGSGLELLGQFARNRPQTLRIFAAERERLKLLKGRLGPFGLFRTLSYPIEPRQLLAALSAAGKVAAETLEAEPKAAQQANTARQSSEPAQRGRRPLAAAQEPSFEDDDPAQASVSHFVVKPRLKSPPPPPVETPSRRGAFLVGVGVTLMLGVLGLLFKIASSDERHRHAINTLSAVQTPRFPPEVIKLVSDTEAALQSEDFKTARTDVAALQQLAPDHPQLPHLESQLRRRATIVLDDLPAPGITPKKPARHKATGAPTPAPRTAPIATFSGKTLEETRK